MEFIQEISLSGFKVVYGQLFTRQTGPSMTMRNRNISFNVPAHEALNHCESVQILVNTEARCIAIKPTNSSDPNAIVWIKSNRKTSSTCIECTPFCKKIFETWGWDPELRYRTMGRLVASEGKLMLLFDWNNPETFTKENHNA